MWEYNYDYLSHHGILGQKWGVRRFQNSDGSLTAAGKGRYVDKNPKLRAMYQKAISAKTDEEKDVLMRKYEDAQIAEQQKNKDSSLSQDKRERYEKMSERSSSLMRTSGSIARASGTLTAAIAGIDVAALAAGSSTILLPIGPAAALIGAGAAYTSALLANKYATKKLGK